MTRLKPIQKKNHVLYIVFITVFNPTKVQIRTKIIKHRGLRPRTDKVPLQVPEGLKEAQDEIKGRLSTQ